MGTQNKQRRKQKESSRRGCISSPRLSHHRTCGSRIRLFLWRQSAPIIELTAIRTPFHDFALSFSAVHLGFPVSVSCYSYRYIPIPVFLFFRITPSPVVCRYLSLPEYSLCKSFLQEEFGLPSSFLCFSKAASGRVPCTFTPHWFGPSPMYTSTMASADFLRFAVASLSASQDLPG